MQPDANLIVHEVLSWVIPGLVTIVLGFPIVRLITKWLEPRPIPPRELSTIDGRLEKIEAAVDAIALEVERISESQRFTARIRATISKASWPRSVLGSIIGQKKRGRHSTLPFSHLSIGLITRR